MVQTEEERKAKAKARQSTPEYKAKKKARQSTPEYKAKAKARHQTPEYKAKAQARLTPEIKAKAKARSSSPEYKAKRKEFGDENRLKILQFYSKRLSNSNIPCCNCCGKNSHVDFLSIDHIAGKKQMNSEPELVKLGYSSKLTSGSLRKWIIENNFPPGFQVLCHNCNKSKGLKDNNNQCSHENYK